MWISETIRNKEEWEEFLKTTNREDSFSTPAEYPCVCVIKDESYRFVYASAFRDRDANLEGLLPGKYHTVVAPPEGPKELARVAIRAMANYLEDVLHCVRVCQSEDGRSVFARMHRYCSFDISTEDSKREVVIRIIQI